MTKQKEKPIDAEVVEEKPAEAIYAEDFLPAEEKTAMKHMNSQTTAVNPFLAMVTTAIEGGAGIEVLEKLQVMQERFEDREAEKAYVLAMTEFRSLCSKIIRTSTVSFKQTNYKFTPLADILEQIKPHMTACGLSHAWITDQKDRIEVTCKVTHMLGHSEETTLMAEADSSGSKNSIQSIGSTVSYLQRYTLKSLLGLAEGDDDGKSADPEPEVELISGDQVNDLDGIINENDIDKDAFLKYFKIESLGDIHAEHFKNAKATLLKSVKS